MPNTKPLHFAATVSFCFLAACSQVPQPIGESRDVSSGVSTNQADVGEVNFDSEAGKTVALVPKIFWIDERQSRQIPHRFLDAVNAIRSQYGLTNVQLSKELNAAARTHARDMAIQNRPWPFGSDGSSPIDRATKVGFEGLLLGENISETYEDDLTTLSAWMQDTNTQRLILDSGADVLGIGWHQEEDGKIWWTLKVGGERSVVDVYGSANTNGIEQ